MLVIAGWITGVCLVSVVSTEAIHCALRTDWVDILVVREANRTVTGEAMAR